MAQASDIRWSSYDVFEGPFFLGRIPYAAPLAPDFGDKCVSVVTATEGGHFDAINMYDSCVLTVGIIQVCERVFECSNMLGACSVRNSAVLAGYLGALPVPLKIAQSPGGVWRLQFADGSGPVASPADMERAYLGGGTGRKGAWTEAQKDFAKRVAAGFATVWEHPDMRAGQLDFIKPRLTQYVLPRARGELFGSRPDDGWDGAIKSMYISYSANIPVVADKRLAVAMADPRWGTADGPGRFRILADSMVRSGVGIWPNRYRAIQPVIAKLFGVNTPSLEAILGTISPSAPDRPTTTDQDYGTVASIQQFLLSRGYDIGPSGADGVAGNYTKKAVMKFQADNGLAQDGVVGPLTQAKMKQVAGTPLPARGPGIPPAGTG